MRKWLGGLVILGLMFGGFVPEVLATSTNSNLNITATITTPAGGGGTTNPPTIDNPPAIAGVSADVSTSTAVVAFTASDDAGISSLSFVYGVTTGYGQTGTISGSYSVSLSSLISNQIYYYKITAVDSGAHSTDYTGNFTTQSVADTTAPIISNITSTPGIGSCNISWTVNELSSGEVLYGATTGYGSSANSSVSLTHSVLLSGLVPSSTYHYKIAATDASDNQSESSDETCRTLADTTPPANPSNVLLATTTNSFIITWTNPLDSDFSGIKMLRKTTGYPVSQSDGILVYNGTEASFNDNSIVSNVTYYYSLFSYDSSGNYSSGANVEGILTATVINEICNNNIDDDHDGTADCRDPDCQNQAACQVLVENCSNGLDDDRDGLIDCADSFCAGANYCAVNTIETCNNGIDDNGNGLIDCDEGSCQAFPSCKSTVGTGGDTPEVRPPTSTVSGSEKLKFSDLLFLGGNRTIELKPVNGTVTGLSGSHLSVGLRASVLPKDAEKVILKTTNGTYQFSLEGGSAYYTDIMFPAIGRNEAYVEVIYSDDSVDSVSFAIQSLSYGQVFSGSEAVSEAEIRLVDERGENVGNLFVTDANGVYGSMVQNGKYQLRISKEGYYERITPVFSVDNNVVNLRVDVIKRPPDLFEKITASSTVGETISQVTKNVAAKTKVVAQQTLEKAKDVVKNVEEIKKDPEVQKAASQVVAPTAVTVAAVSTVAFVSWADLIPFLRLLFLQPLMLLGHGRRKGWGQIYNALNKMPVDLATVRLLSEGKVVQSKVSDKEGRYAFVVNPGKYTIQIIKNGFVFPSALLANYNKDGRHTDIYHGEVIEVAEKDAIITANIPLDPVGEVKKPVRIFWQKFGRLVQISVSWAGILVTLASLYISPKWYVWTLLAVHVILFIVFRRLAVPPKVKSWGIVYDAESKKPVGRTVARLFNSEFNKLVATQITDGSGRYYFLAGDDKYYVTYDHPQYAAEKTGVLDLTGKDVETITVDVGLNKPNPIVTPNEPTIKPA